MINNSAHNVKIPERVHVAPVGFEIDRIVLPFLEMKGERIHLIVRKERNARGDRCVEGITQELKRHSKPFELHKIDLDLFKIIHVCRQVIAEELKSKNHVFVNISSGGSIQAVASHFATLTFRDGVSAYYAYPETYVEKVDPSRPQASSGISRIEVIPHYSIELPDDTELAFLKIVAEARIPSKRAILEECRRRGIISQEGKSKPYGHVVLENKFVKPLESSGLLRVLDKGRRSRILLTEKGLNTLHLSGWFGEVRRE